MNNNRTDDDGDIRKSVTEVVNEDTAEIQVAAPTNQRESNAAVHRESGKRSPNHPAFDNGYGSAQPLDCFVTEPQRKKDKHDGISERRESTSAMIAVRF